MMRICSIACLFILFISPLHLMAQPKPYDYGKKWLELEAALRSDLPKSAQAISQEIYRQAKKDNNQGQLLKAIVYRFSTGMHWKEDAVRLTMDTLQQELASLPQPSQQVMHSMIAGLYHQYYNQQSWRIRQRTPLAQGTSGNIDTWTSADFTRAIQSHYQASLANAALLQQVPVSQLEPVVIPGNQRALRPTLYDLLAHEALNYYTRMGDDDQKPIGAFENKDAASLAIGPIFMRHTYTTTDTTSRQYLALRLYQDLLRFHKADANPDAYLDADRERLKYAVGNSSNAHKDRLYRETLDETYHAYAKSPAAAETGFLLASQWQEQGRQYQPGLGTPEQASGLVTALALAKKIAADHPKSEGGLHAAAMVADLEQPHINLQAERVNSLAKPFRVLAEFTNTPALHLRLLRITPEVYEWLHPQSGGWNEKAMWHGLAAQPQMRSWTQTMPAMTDLRQHRAELKIDALPQGHYLVLASNTAQFAPEKNALAAVELHVSNISYIRSQNDVFILDRESGQPLENATVAVWGKRYDYESRQRKQERLYTLTSDAQGRLTLPESGKREQNFGEISFDITWQKDRLHLREGNYLGRNWNYQPDQDKDPWRDVSFYFFTDRSLYRPGQTVYYKAIGVVKPNTHEATPYTGNKKLTVQLRDANYEIVQEQSLRTNAYGSLQGSFVLPAGGRTGDWQLTIDETDNGQASFKVEEYKRPRFYVELKQPAEAYVAGDTMQVTGRAMAYAGNAIDGAQITYRVYRQSRFAEPWLLWRYSPIWPPDRGETGRQEIAFGTVQADAEGRFIIRFEAQPDGSIDRKLKPVFDYVVETVVADPNGETHEASITTSAGYHRLQLGLEQTGGTYQLQGKIAPVAVRTTTVNGEPLRLAVSATLHSLQVPAQAYRQRYWAAPDTAVLDEASFRQAFATDPYRNEHDYHTWPTRQQVWQGNLAQTDSLRQLILPANLAPGWYLLEATTQSSSGETTTARHYLAVYNAKQLAAPDMAFVPNTVQRIEPGEEARFILGTSAQSLYVIQQRQIEERRLGEFAYLDAARNINTYRFGATEMDRGGYSVNQAFVYNNRLYTQQWLVAVPWTNKQLKLELQTFRNKLLPGQQEQWKIKLSGSASEAVAAEVLASMYDASLDAIHPHQWNAPQWWPSRYVRQGFGDVQNFRAANGRSFIYQLPHYSIEKSFDDLLKFQSIHEISYSMRKSLMHSTSSVEGLAGAAPGLDVMSATGGKLDEVVVTAYGVTKEMADSAAAATEKSAPIPDGQTAAPAVRKNFQETAFFYPQLYTDSKGELSFSFTMPEALTQWKLQLFAHTPTLASALSQATTVTQKELMVQPNLPRFLREGDAIELATRIVNASDRELTGIASLELLDAATGKPVDGLFMNAIPQQYFTLAAGQSNTLRFPIQVPAQYTSAVTYRIVARSTTASTNLSDGEEMTLPVLSNRMLVTESLPLHMRNTAAKTFAWPKLQQAGASPTLQHHSLTVEYTTNPVWYAVQALPYLMEYPYDCAEQTWNRFYANALASNVANSTPKLKEVFDTWKNKDSAALVSNLMKNPELKQVLLEETPWVLQAKNENEQKRQIALLFDLVRMQNESERALNKLSQLQSSNGGFVWFKGGPDDRYMTQYIATGIGHLRKLNAQQPAWSETLQLMGAKAVAYLDARIMEDYNDLVRRNADLGKQHLGQLQIQYLYMRSFFGEVVKNPAVQKAYDYYMGQARTHWATAGLQGKGMLALVMHRSGNNPIAASIIKSLEENSLTNEEMGMYWKELNNPSYYWWQAPIETHALLLEAFAEINNRPAQINDLKTWLLKQKQTTSWKTTKATAEACYALLMNGSNWLQAEQEVRISLGNTTIQPQQTEAGTGYFKTVLSGEKVKPEMGTIAVKISGGGDSKNQPPSYGAVYWQYFENLDAITSSNNNLQVKKELYKKVNTSAGPQLQAIGQNQTNLKPGDKVVVRIELTTDRNLEYVHVKDMRAAAFEPAEQLSQYKYQDGLGFYQSPRDASMNYFIGYLPRGTYVLQYELLTTQAGTFSNGITSVQCMYAPEFGSHSGGMQVLVQPVD